MLDKLGALTPPIESVLDLLGHYPRRYHDRTRQSDIAELEVGRGGDDRRRGAAGVVAARRASARRWSRPWSRTTAASLNLVFFNQPWREKQLAPGHRGRALREARRVPRQAPAHEPDRRRARPGRRHEDRRRHADLPAVGQGRRLDVGDPAASSRRCSTGRASSPRRCPRTSSASSSSLDRTDGVPRRPPARVDRRGAEGAAPAALRRVPPHAGGARRAQARDRGRARRASRTPVDGELRHAVPRRRSRTSSPATSSATIDAIAADMARPGPDAPAAAGRGRLGQDRSSRSPRC